MNLNLRLPLSADRVLEALQTEHCGLITIFGWAFPAAEAKLSGQVLAVNHSSLPALRT